MMRLLSLLLLLLLMTGCQRYTIGAQNAAPRVVSGNTETAMAEPSEEAGDHATETSTDHSSGSTEPLEEAGHGTSIPELDAALVVVHEAFAHARGSRVVRHETAEALEAARQSVYALYEAGTISHGSELDEYFETAIEKVSEGTNDAPNALNRLVEKLEKAGKH